MNLNEMTEVDAMQLITKICGDFKGNLVDHQMIQQALNIIRNKAFPVPVEDKDVPETLKPDFNGNKKKK